MFLAYDGSHTYMGRDGVRDEYLSNGVPAEIEQQWRDELDEKRRAAITEPGNWQSVSYFQHHGDHTHLQEILDAGPLGEWWERCAYLETTLGYIEFTCRMHYPVERLAEACRFIHRHAGQLGRDGVAEDQPPSRLPDLLARAERLADSLT